jgi:alkylated DNA repair dioxygenase AlkB
MTPDVILIEGFLTKDEADQLFSRVKTEAFRQYASGQFGHPRPRLECWFGTWDYQYGRGETLKAQMPMPDYLTALIDKIVAAGYGAEYNGLLINWYKDGSQSIGAHSDDDYGDPFPTIPTLVLGAARPLLLTLKADKKVNASYSPGHGDLLVMRGTTNAEWKHEIKKTEKEVGERVSLTFRCKL